MATSFYIHYTDSWKGIMMEKINKEGNNINGKAIINKDYKRKKRFLSFSILRVIKVLVLKGTWTLLEQRPANIF